MDMKTFYQRVFSRVFYMISGILLGNCLRAFWFHEIEQIVWYAMFSIIALTMGEVVSND